MSIEIQTNIDCNAPLPLDARHYGDNLSNINKYRYMIYINKVTGRMYQLRPKAGIAVSNEDYDTNWEFVDLITFFKPEIINELIAITNNHESRISQIEILLAGIDHPIIEYLNALDIRLDNIETWKISVDNYISNLLSRMNTAEANIITNANCIRYILSLIQQLHINNSAIHNMTTGIQGGIANIDPAIAERYHLSHIEHLELITTLAGLYNLGFKDDGSALNGIINYIINHFDSITNPYADYVNPVMATESIKGHVKTSASIQLIGGKLSIPNVKHDRSVENIYTCVNRQTAPVAIHTTLATHTYPYDIRLDDFGKSSTISLSLRSLLTNDIILFNNTYNSADNQICGIFKDYPHIDIICVLNSDPGLTSHLDIIHFHDRKNDIIAEYDLIHKIVCKTFVSPRNTNQSIINKTVGTIVAYDNTFYVAKYNTDSDASINDYDPLIKVHSFDIIPDPDESYKGTIPTNSARRYFYSPVGMDMLAASDVSTYVNKYAFQVRDYFNNAYKIKGSRFVNNNELYLGVESDRFNNVVVINCENMTILESSNARFENIKLILDPICNTTAYGVVGHTYREHITTKNIFLWHIAFYYANMFDPIKAQNFGVYGDGIIISLYYVDVPNNTIVTNVTKTL